MTRNLCTNCGYLELGCTCNYDMQELEPVESDPHAMCIACGTVYDELKAGAFCVTCDSTVPLELQK